MSVQAPMNHIPQQHGIPGGMGGAGRPANGLSAVQHPTHFTPTYAGYLLRKSVQQPGDWTQPHVEPYSVNARSFELEKRKGKGESWMTVYSALRAEAQRHAISEILKTQRLHETNPFATWDYALILPTRSAIRGTFGGATETTSIRLILKRQPRSDPSIQLSPITKFGGVLDTTQQPYVLPNASVPAALPGAHLNHPLHQNHQSHQNQLPGPPPEKLPPPPMKDGRPHVQGLPNQNFHKADGMHQQPKMNNKMQMPAKMQVPGNPARNSMDFKEKLSNWNPQPLGNRANDSDSSDSDDSDDFVRDFPQSKGGKLPLPPLGAMPFASGAIPKHGVAKSHPILKQKPSKSDMRYQQRVDKKMTGRLQDDSSDDSRLGSSYDKLEDFSSRHSYSTRGTDYSSGSSDGHRFPRSRSRDRGRRDRRGHRSFSRDQSRDAHRLPKQSSHRVHRRPSPYRGLSPSRDSDRDRDNRPLVVHIHNENPTGNDQKRVSTSPLTSSVASGYSNAYPMSTRALPYPEDDVFNMSPVQNSLPQAPMAMDYVRTDRLLRQHQQEKAAEAYMRSQERRTANAQTTAQVVEAYERGRNAQRRQEEDRQWKEDQERQRLLDEAQRLENLKRRKQELIEQMKEDDLIDRLRKDRDREYVQRPREFTSSLRDYEPSVRRFSRKDLRFDDDEYMTRRESRYDDLEFPTRTGRRTSILRERI